jgi:hypothetical protein
MEIEEFASITRNVIAESGFDDFLPTACFPERREVRTLAGFPDDEDPERPVLEWAQGHAVGPEEFLVAFKVDASHFKIIRKCRDATASKTFAVACGA